MTCNECIHQELCDFYAKLGLTDIPADDVTPCDLFKRKSDVVEVVRCKDCIHFSNDTDYCREHNKGYCEFDNVIKPPTYYCSYGERKEVDNGHP